MSEGFALVASSAQYNVTGVMTFVINQDGIAREKDLGSGRRGGSTHDCVQSRCLLAPGPVNVGRHTAQGRL